MSDFDWNGNGRSDIGDDYIAYRIISDDDSGSGGGGNGGGRPPGSGGAGCGSMFLMGLIIWLILRVIM